MGESYSWALVQGNRSELDVPAIYELSESEEIDQAKDTADNNSEIYEYDLPESFGTFFLEDLVPTSIVYGTTLILGLIGNSLIIFTVVRYRRMRTISNFFLASLATADLLLILVCVPVKYAQLFSYTWSLGAFCCKFVHYIQNVSAITSVLTLTAMSVERYYAIIHPVKSRYLCTIGQARRVIILIWLSSLVAALPIIFVQVLLPVGERFTGFWCVKAWDHPILWKVYECYMLVLVLILPSVVMAYAYTRICFQLWIVVKERASMMAGESGTEMTFREPHPKNHFATQSASGKPKSIYMKVDDDTNTVKQVIKMLAAVVILFIICWSPILINNVLTAFDILDKLNYGFLKPMRTTFHLMSYFNSCVNPCVYGFMSQTFRNSFKAALSSCFCGSNEQQQQGRPSMSRTRTTSISYGRSTYVS